MLDSRRINRVREALDRHESAVGVTVQISSPEVIEIAGRCGYDFVWIDCEHGSFYLDRLVEMLRAADGVGLTALVRVPSDEPSYISRVLDAGALGIIVPNLSSREQAKAAISAARYKQGNNGGRRGACPGTRATWHQTGNWPAFVQWSNENVMVWATIENLAGVENFDEILEEPLDGIALGPFDLAHDMGYPGEPSHPKVVEALSGVVSKAAAKNIPVIATLFSADPVAMGREREQWAARGAQVFSIGTDRCLIAKGMSDRLNAVKV